MSDYILVSIKNIFSKCLEDCAVFHRPDSDGKLFESEVIHKENKTWLVIAAGLCESEANKWFSGHKKRAENSIFPILFKQRCEISMLFVVRAYDGNSIYSNPMRLIVPFAIQQQIPYLEMSQAYVRIWGVPDNYHNLMNLRWEWDTRPTKNYPYEKWLRNWTYDIGFNPAHPPSHLHINTERLDPSKLRTGDLCEDLRLAIGNLNPLSFLFSLAVWLRTLT